MYVEQVHDYELKYLDCIVKVDGKLVKLNSFGLNGETNKIEALVVEVAPNKSLNAEGECITMEDKLLDWRMPQLGFINTHRQAIWSERVVNDGKGRFRRALCSHNVIFRPVARSKAGNILYDKFQVCVHYLYNPIYFTVTEALVMLNDWKRPSVALNHRFCIIKRNINDVDRVELAYKARVIGEVSPFGDISISGELSFLYEELSQLGFNSICFN